MKASMSLWTVLLLCFLLGGAASARAAGSYTLTCEPQRGDSFTIILTGFNFKVTGGAESPTGMAAGKRTGFELSIRFALNKDYEALVSMAEDNEVMRSCKLTDGDVTGGMPAGESVTKGKNAKMKNGAAPASNGPFQWILSNATFTSVAAMGSENNAGTPESSVQATIEAQKYTFTM
jgi:hypothetical protein